MPLIAFAFAFAFIVISHHYNEVKINWLYRHDIKIKVLPLHFSLSIIYVKYLRANSVYNSQTILIFYQP